MHGCEEIRNRPPECLQPDDTSGRGRKPGRAIYSGVLTANFPERVALCECGRDANQVPGNRKTNSAFPVPPGMAPAESMVPLLPDLPLTSVNLFAVAYDQSSVPSEAKRFQHAVELGGEDNVVGYR